MRTFSFQLLALQAVSATSLLDEMYGNGFVTSAGLQQPLGDPSPSVGMLYKGSHFHNSGSAPQKSEGKFQNETKPRSNLGF